MAEEQEGPKPIDPELIKSTVDLMQRAADRALADRVAKQRWREEHRAEFQEAAARGEWVPAWVKQPAAQLPNEQIVREAQNTHKQYQAVVQEYPQASEARQAELRTEMQPLVERARELRQEYSARIQPEMSRDAQIGFGQ
jgi:hypothetical protein